MTITAEQIMSRILRHSLDFEAAESEAQSILDTIRAEATAAAYGAAADVAFGHNEATKAIAREITALTDADATAWLAADRAAQFKAGQEAALKGAVKGWALLRDGKIAHIRQHQEALYGLGSGGDTIRPCLILVGEGE